MNRNTSYYCTSANMWWLMKIPQWTNILVLYRSFSVDVRFLHHVESTVLLAQWNITTTGWIPNYKGISTPKSTFTFLSSTEHQTLPNPWLSVQIPVVSRYFWLLFPRTYFHLLLRKFSAGVRFQPTFSLSVHLWAQLHSLAVSDSSSHPQAAAHNSLLPFLFQHNPFTIHILFISRLSDLASQLCNCPGPGKQHFPNWLLNYCYFNSLEVVYPRYLVSIAVLLPIAFHFLQTKHLSWIYLYK